MDSLRRAVEAGTLDADGLERLVDESMSSLGALSAIADMALAAGMIGAYTKLVAHADGNTRAAAAHAAAWSKHKGAAALLMGRLGEEGDDQVRMLLVGAIGSFGHEYDAFVDQKLAGQDPWEVVGAIWAGQGRPLSAARRERVRQRVADDNHEVRRAATAALAVDDGAQDLIELKWCELLNINDWWPWALPLRGLRARCAPEGWPLPRAVRSFSWISDDDVAWDDAELDAAVAFDREHPQQLVRWISQDSTIPASQRTRAARYAGLVGGPELRAALEQALLSTTSQVQALEIALELACLGGPRTAPGRLKAQLSIGDRTKAGADDLLPTVAFAFSGDSILRRRAAVLLKGMGADAEPYLLALVGDIDPSVAQAAADAVAQMAGLTDPHLQDIARLLNSEVRSLADLNAPHRLVSSRSMKVKQALCELCALVPEREQAARFLVELAADRYEHVAAAATAGRGAVFPAAAWVSQHVLQSSWSDGWRTREAAFQAMAQIGDPVFLPRLLEVIAGTDEHLKNLAIVALERIAEKNTDRGLLVLDIRDPDRVREQYGLDVHVNYDADQHSEGLRLLLLGLQKRRTPPRSRDTAAGR